MILRSRRPRADRVRAEMASACACQALPIPLVEQRTAKRRRATGQEPAVGVRACCGLLGDQLVRPVSEVGRWGPPRTSAVAGLRHPQRPLPPINESPMRYACGPTVRPAGMHVRDDVCSRPEGRLEPLAVWLYSNVHSGGRRTRQDHDGQRRFLAGGQAWSGHRVGDDGEMTAR